MLQILWICHNYAVFIMLLWTCLYLSLLLFSFSFFTRFARSCTNCATNKVSILPPLIALLYSNSHAVTVKIVTVKIALFIDVLYIMCIV